MGWSCYVCVNLVEIFVCTFWSQVFMFLYFALSYIGFWALACFHFINEKFCFCLKKKSVLSLCLWTQLLVTIRCYPYKRHVPHAHIVYLLNKVPRVPLSYVLSTHAFVGLLDCIHVQCINLPHLSRFTLLDVARLTWMSAARQPCNHMSHMSRAFLSLDVRERAITHLIHVGKAWMHIT